MSYRVHHLNAATLCPGTRRLVNGGRGWLARGELVCHCLLIETEAGLVLVDTGFSEQDFRPASLADRAQLALLGLRGDPAECALSQVRALGFDPADVRHIVLTHLDIDHAGGIKDFPQARVHLHRQEWQAGTRPATWSERHRYNPVHWAHGPDWQLHEPTGERWFGFSAVRLLDERVPDLLLIPLPGHSRGHSGLALPSGDGWLLHCGDAYFHHDEIAADRPRRPPAISLIEAATETSRADRLHNLERLRELHRREDSVRLICSHDPTEFEACRHGH